MDLRERVILILKATSTIEPARRLYHATRRLVPSGAWAPSDDAGTTGARHARWRPVAVPRVDPAPEPQPFPEARYIVAVGAIYQQYGGRTASILTKTRLLAERAGVKTQIVSMNYSRDWEVIVDEITQRGALGTGVTLHNLHYWLSGAEEAAASAGGAAYVQPVKREPDVEVLGYTVVQDEGTGTYRYYQGGVYRMLQQFDAFGRLRIREYVNEQRLRTQRDEFYPTGTVRRTIYYDTTQRQADRNKPRQEVFFRSDGTPYLNRWLKLNPRGNRAVPERVTLFDRAGAVTHVFHEHIELAQHYLDHLVAGHPKVFLTVEARLTDAETLPWKRPNVKQLYVLHNPHLAAPFDDLTKVRPIYKRLLDKHAEIDAIVFLTNGQRADAEAVYGRQESWAVIPHPAREVAAPSTVARDPRLVVAVARLEPQKRLDHAVEAFAQVIDKVPDARLEIYGIGPERGKLQALIESRGLHHSVRLRGYSANIDEVYQRASLSVLTSKHEGFGLVLLESLQNGCPVVSYDVKYGPSDIITDGVDGYLVTAGAVSVFAERIVRLLRDESLRSSFGHHAYAAAESYRPDTFVARWAALYNRLDDRGWTTKAELEG